MLDAVEASGIPWCARNSWIKVGSLNLLGISPTAKAEALLGNSWDAANVGSRWPGRAWPRFKKK